MTEGSGTPLECPGCGYTTRAWDHDGHASICPECNTEALLPEADAAQLTRNRLEASGAFTDALNAEKATDAIFAPEGSTDSDRVTLIDGVPVIESSPTPIMDRLETVPMYEMGSKEPVDFIDMDVSSVSLTGGSDAVRTFGGDTESFEVVDEFEGSYSFSLDAEENEDVLDALRTAAAEVKRNAPDDYRSPDERR